MLKVVLADDEPWVLEGLRTMVDWDKYGFEVTGEALNGPDAVRLILEKKPDLVLTDINMPVLSGLEMIAKLNDTMEEPPRFVILSGYDDFHYAKAALRQRVIQYLLKPIDDEEIEDMLSRIRTDIQNEIGSKKEEAQKRLLIASSLFNRLVRGESSEQLEDAAAGLLGIRPDTEVVFALLGTTGDPLELHGLAGECFPRGTVRTVADDAGRSGMIVHSAGLTAEYLDAAFSQLSRELTEQRQEPVVVFLSPRMKGARALRELYTQTLETWKVKCCRDKGGVIYCEHWRKADPGDEPQGSLFAGLLEQVKCGEAAKIPAAVKRIFTALAEQGLDIPAVQAAVADLEMSFCKLAAELNGDPGHVLNGLQPEYGGLGGIADYAGLSQYLQELCLRTAAYLGELREANEGNTIFNVIQYVDLEFRNKLQLQDLARQFHMNAAYLGQLFRKETGCSFSEYLNEKRIEAAKGLLKRTQLKISDIALQVGFTNTDYFIDKFKTVVGVVPSVYKNGDHSKQH
ncbi:response regulator transcription factor [Paenibacillus tepidiphilus]|uniref:response regulator transcription factor n=1 Tax=Paenibacillus tepidiphilus TaxID=2608683 RepID=UPI0013A52F4D|nr:response regulator [Paenibacillus tepidiphilus]